MAQRSKGIIATRAYYCKDGMLNSFKRYKLPDCRESALEKVKKCAESFHRKFRENRGSRSLCRLEKHASLLTLNHISTIVASCHSNNEPVGIQGMGYGVWGM